MDYSISNLKLIIVNYFEKVKNEIDIESETRLMELKNDKKESDKQMQEQIDDLNSIRNEFVDAINALITNNVACFEKNKNSQVMEELIRKMNLTAQTTVTDSEKEIDEINSICPVFFSEFCFYIKKEKLGNYPGYKKLGLLVVTDKYVSTSQLDSLKYLFKYRQLFNLK